MIAVGIAFIMIGVPETAFETFFGGAPVVLVIENVIRRLAHRRKARRLLRDGSWWIGTIWHPSNERVDQHDSLHDGTYELNGGAVRFQYQTADGTRYEAEAPCRYGRFVIEDRLRIDVVTHPKAPHSGVVFIPGEGLRFFEGKEVASSGAIAQPVGEIEAVIRDGLVRTIVEWTAWFGLVTTGVVVGSFVAVIACLAVFGLAA